MMNKLLKLYAYPTIAFGGTTFVVGAWATRKNPEDLKCILPASLGIGLSWPMFFWYLYKPKYTFVRKEENIILHRFRESDISHMMWVAEKCAEYGTTMHVYRYYDVYIDDHNIRRRIQEYEKMFSWVSEPIREKYSDNQK